MAKRTVEVKLPSAYPRRHSNPGLFVPLKLYVLVASGSTPSKINHRLGHAPPAVFVLYLLPYILLASSQVEHTGFILWDPALRCGTSMGFVVRAKLFSAILGWLSP